MPEIDSAKAEAFGGKMVGLINDAMLSMAVSIGHRTRLFDTMSQLPPSTSDEIASAAGLSERYVREWLGAMVTGRIVEHDAERRTYFLPPEHAGLLTRAAGTNNFANFTQYVAVLAGVEDQIVECFHKGGGVPYAAFRKFQILQAEETAAIFDANLISRTLPLIPGIVERLGSGIRVLDIGCGAGHAVNLIAQSFPRSHVAGYDFSEEGVALGRAEAQAMKLDNAFHEVKDVATFDAEAQFDLITAFDTIHDQADPARVLRNVHRALRPDGWFLCVDIAGSSHLHENMDHPLAPAMYTVSTMHCMTVSLALGGAGLGTMWGEQRARQMLIEAGFTEPRVERVEGDAFNNYYIAQKA